jgi:uncharacterized coiled-coil protein SlyX
MVEYDFKNMTNNEIKLEMTKLEKSYEKIKVDIASLLKKMKELDESYIKAKKELINRSKVMTNG